MIPEITREPKIFRRQETRGFQRGYWNRVSQNGGSCVFAYPKHRLRGAIAGSVETSWQSSTLLRIRQLWIRCAVRYNSSCTTIQTYPPTARETAHCRTATSRIAEPRKRTARCILLPCGQPSPPLPPFCASFARGKGDLSG